MTFSHLLRSGALAGVAAGLFSASVMWLVTEPLIGQALAIEAARPPADVGPGHGHEVVVSRSAQVVLGLGVAAVAAMLFGLLFAVVFATTRHRLPGLTDPVRTLWLGMIGFGVFAVLPGLVTPANPPAVGDPSTVTRRTLISCSRS